LETITRRELKDSVYKQVPSLTREQASQLVDEVFEEIISALISGQEVRLHSFGKFKLHFKKERIGRNPKTGIAAIISARRTVSFTPSKQLVSTVKK
jgi:integration host factor subunit alpha